MLPGRMKPKRASRKLKEAVAAILITAIAPLLIVWCWLVAEIVYRLVRFLGEVSS